ncbi:MAG: hypothetical protein KAJ93_00970 [Methanosarcinales archaeon]|nr:hypothetical protein [Methanosarcinales archaeon]
MITTASASIRPNYVELFHGLEPAMWLAIVVGACALIDNIGRFIDKKRSNPDIKYDFAYFQTTLLTIVMMCMGVLQTEVVELTPYAVLGAIILGFGGNEVITRTTKVVK